MLQTKDTGFGNSRARLRGYKNMIQQEKRVNFIFVVRNEINCGGPKSRVYELEMVGYNKD